ncbi:aconitate hydratase [Candidatus Formimonas warabiya]|uniref:Aconitate hydratase n=1 Tax=Formimonas warabiya TaxID=1761012 RepID=A0A3G1KML6_FORW1|nr:aconitate hydratase [Candidatus Formimonas warabiya]ATW23679.1 aconitate hydratase [Candidatus Formimonas warabiya]
MGQNIVEKILATHLLKGKIVPGEEIAIRIDQTLTQDATGTMAYLQFEAMEMPRVKTELSVSYVDHNTLQTGFENMDDHRFLQSIAAKYGIYYSRPGNGICHQVHLERFGAPGKTLLGADSHTPTGGAMGMIAIGAGGLDVAVAMAGGPFYLTMPQIIKVHLTGRLSPWVSAKDVILELLRIMTVKGGLGKMIEYGGPGVKSLAVPERATIANMGAELGITTSIFPSDAVTRDFLHAQGRGEIWQELEADENASYDGRLEINLEKIEPLAAKPHMPDHIAKITDIGPIKVDQVLIGSCTNSSYKDLMTVAAILKGKKIHPAVHAGIAPGSKQVLEMLARNGALADLISSGARILECTCGFCIGMGQAPNSGAVSLRTNNRNFLGRSGTCDAQVYLTSPETAAASALTGVLTDPRTLGESISLPMPSRFLLDDSMIIPPSPENQAGNIIRGPNIKPLPLKKEMPGALQGMTLIKTGDNVTTDDIMPAGANILPLRSNIPALSRFVFSRIDDTFALRAKEAGGGVIVGGFNYGQGSSREHAALAHMYLRVCAIIAKSFARIHKANLINFGILPLTFDNPEDYGRIDQDDLIGIPNLRAQLSQTNKLWVHNQTKQTKFLVTHDLSSRQIGIIRAGGLLNYTKIQAEL